MTLEASLCSFSPLIYIHLPPSILDAKFIPSQESRWYPLLISIRAASVGQLVSALIYSLIDLQWVLMLFWENVGLIS